LANLDNLVFHIVKEEDLDVLQQISEKTFHDAFFHLNSPESYFGYTNRAFSKDQLRSEILNPDSQFQFLKSGNDVLAYFKLNFNQAQSDLKDPRALEIERIYVLKEYQNLNIGKHVLNHIKEIARLYKLEYIWLGVWEKNVNAIRFYEKNGFQLFSSHEFLLGSEVQIDLLMKWLVK
jgi:ribosomal protein S18 acetylase RimI-like enzyme